MTNRAMFQLLVTMACLQTGLAQTGCGLNEKPAPTVAAPPPRIPPKIDAPPGKAGTVGQTQPPGNPDKPKEAPPIDRKIEIVEQRYPNGMASEQIEGYRTPEGEFVRHGVYMQYFDDGTKRTQLHYVDGARHGPRVSWYPTGQIWSRGEYVNERENGTWTAWWPNGFKQREWFMREGTWHGVYTEWHDNGEKKMQFEYVEGLKQGPMTIWDPEGNAIHKSEYVNDVEQPKAP